MTEQEKTNQTAFDPWAEAFKKQDELKKQQEESQKSAESTVGVPVAS